MISRRSRIKGIANIPQRRKQTNDDNETQTEEVEASNKRVTNEETVANKKRKLSETVVSNEDPIKQKKSISDQSTKTKNTSFQQESPIDKVDHTKTKEAEASNKRLPDEDTVAYKKRKLSEPVYKNSSTISTSNTDACFQKPLLITSNAVTSDTEYPLPPPSPNKANRTRIKATPRLAHRKMSFSASESEDETRKVARIRTESVSSNVVTNDFILPEYTISSQRRKETIVTPKKTSRSEQTRKLAEARREFVRRFGEKKPERNKLTMMDLIFYNPNSNPMDIADTEKNSVDDPEIEITTENLADNPSNNEEDNGKSDEENSMPVPQIKIGPSGEIILDEQSLLIETKDVQKKREEMNKTKIVDADAIKTGYGIYKRQNRSKCWSECETIRFYKALNSIGTDFTLMSELFPNRTRRELKMKFKKEEKTNRQLIDRAMMQPCRFDFEDLKCELEMEEREMNALRIQNEKQKKEKEENMKKQQHKILEKAKKKKLVETPSEAQIENSEKDEAKQATRGRGRPKKTNKISIENFMSDSDADESDLGTQSESDEEILLSRKPTRSGRLPKIVQRYENEHTSLKSIISGSKVTNPEEISNIAPGSIMVVNETGPAGEPVYKIYMVTPEQNARELDLSSDIVTKVLQMKEGITAESIMTISTNVTDEEDAFEENNVTIPAEENVTTLKTDGNKKDSNRINEISMCIQEADIVLETESGKKIYTPPSEDDIVHNLEA